MFQVDEFCRNEHQDTDLTHMMRYIKYRNLNSLEKK